jgi:hypothetical protein
MKQEFRRTDISRYEYQQQNIRAIYQAGEILIFECDFCVSGDYFVPVAQLGDSCTLSLRLRPPSIGYDCVRKPILVTKVALQDVTGCLAEHTLSFFEERDESTVIESSFYTSEGHQSKGFGEGLFRFAHQLNQRLVDSEPFAEKQVIAEILDITRDVNEGKGWTSFIAEQLGYIQHEIVEIEGRLFPLLRYQYR